MSTVDETQEVPSKLCEVCGTRPARRRVTYRQNIGMLVLRWAKTVQGDMCSSCIHRCFWECSLITLLVGWIGVLSLVIAPIFLVGNLLNYIGILGEESPMVTRRVANESPRLPAKAKRDEKEECYLCGKPLQTEELASRVCQSCKA
jgi:hypothetical protein